MAAPSVTVTVRDGGLNIIAPGTGGLFAKIGPCPAGVVNQVYSAADNATIQKTLGNGGSLVEAAALAITIGGQGPVRPSGLLLVPVNPSTYGSAGAVTHSGPGTGTVAVASKPAIAFVIKCIAGGTATTSTWQTSIDGGVTWTGTWTAAATIIVPGAPFTTLAFGAGTAVTGDVVTVPASATAPSLLSGTGTLVPTISSACPVDAYSVVITITASGGLGVGLFTYSLDGGTTTSAPFLIPGSGSFPIPDGIDLNGGSGAFKAAGVTWTTGLVLTFAGTFTSGDTYSFTTTSASYSTTDLTNAHNVLVADQRLGSGVGLHIVGAPASVGAAATLLAAVDVLMAAETSAFKFNGAVIEVPVDTDSNILAAFATSSSLRVGACVSTEAQVSPLNGRVLNRSTAWQIMARAGCVTASEALGRVDTGSLPGVVKLNRDEQATPGLDTGRFMTLTTIPGKNGFYITGPGRLMAPVGSDFTFWPYRRVIDLTSFYARQAFLKFENDSVRVNADGTIAEKEAKKIEGYATSYIQNALAGLVSDVFVTVSRTNNLLQTQTILPTVRVVPLGLALFIPVDLGFANASLTIKPA